MSYAVQPLRNRTAMIAAAKIFIFFIFFFSFPVNAFYISPNFPCYSIENLQRRKISKSPFKMQKWKACYRSRNRDAEESPVL